MTRSSRARRPAGKAVRPLSDEQYRALADFRYALRAFLAFSDAATRKSGVTSQQYQALLAIRASRNNRLLVGELADALMLKHNNTVQLVDRLVEANLVRRGTSEDDRRAVALTLTAAGEKKLSRLAAVHYLALLGQRAQLSDISRLATRMRGLR